MRNKRLIAAGVAVVDVDVVVVDVVEVENAGWIFCWTRGRSAVRPVSGCKIRRWNQGVEHTQP